MTIAEKVKSKKIIHKIHEKHYGNGSKKNDVRIALTDKANKIIAEKGPSRNDLMLKVKAAGIKLFRIMNKAELTEILTATPERIVEIQKQANARWKAGFGNRKKEPVNVAA